MKFVMMDADRQELDEISWADGAEPVFTTGKASSLFSARRLTLGDQKTRQQLRNWSNGYVIVMER